jgi:hypothetical protein
MAKVKGTRRRQKDEVVRLEDLAPRKEILGGGRRAVFGQAAPSLPDRPGGPERAPRTPGERKPSK